MYSQYYYYGRDLVPATRTSVHNRNYYSNGFGSQQYSLVRRYTIRHHTFTLHQKITIYENGHEQYFFRGGLLSGRINNLLLEDRFGSPLIRIEKEPGHFFRPPYKLFSYNGQELARIKQHHGGSRFDIDTVYGPYYCLSEFHTW